MNASIINTWIIFKHLHKDDVYGKITLIVFANRLAFELKDVTDAPLCDFEFVEDCNVKPEFAKQKQSTDMIYHQIKLIFLKNQMMQWILTALHESGFLSCWTGFR